MNFSSFIFIILCACSSSLIGDVTASVPFVENYGKVAAIKLLHLAKAETTIDDDTTITTITPVTPTPTTTSSSSSSSSTTTSSSTNQINIDQVFNTAWTFKHRISELSEIQLTLTYILENSSHEALAEFEKEVNQILAIEQPIRQQLNAIPLNNSCVFSLLFLLDSITEFTGYQASNCIKIYDQVVTEEVTKVQDIVSLYNEIYIEVLQLTIKAFTDRNIFTQQNDIINRFESDYERYISNLEAIKPQIDDIKLRTYAKINEFTQDMKNCMANLQNNVEIQYEMIVQQIQICLDFENMLL